MGQDVLTFPSEGRRAEEFFFVFAMKNPTASGWFKHANLGTKGQHGTSRSSKPYEKEKFYSSRFRF
jgi:hypothetical protein